MFKTGSKFKIACFTFLEKKILKIFNQPCWSADRNYLNKLSFLRRKKAKYIVKFGPGASFENMNSYFLETNVKSHPLELR